MENTQIAEQAVECQAPHKNFLNADFAMIAITVLTLNVYVLMLTFISYI